MIEQELKERLIGAAVLVTLGVIFIPLFLDGPAQPGPDIDQRTLPVPDYVPPPAAASPEIKPETRPSAPSRNTVSEPPPAEAAARVSVPEDPLSAWAVQVGSFSSQENAERLRDELKKKGYRAFVTRLNENTRTLYRVRVGPEQDRERADLLARRLRKDGQPTSIVRHP